MQITIFNAVGDTKHPVSIYKDDSYLFTNVKHNSLKELMTYMINNFTLSKPLNLTNFTKSKRRIEDLKDYISDSISTMAIDIDKIKSKKDLNRIVQHFKDKNIGCILCESKSYNGIDNFNIKGIIKIDSINSPYTLKTALNELQRSIGDIADIDDTVANTVSYQAPTFKNKIIYLNEEGKPLKPFKNIIEEPKIKQVEIELDSDFNDVVNKSLDIFSELGYTIDSSKMNDNGSVNFSHVSENKSKGGYFWYSSNPFVMNHHVKDKSISIFNMIKQTKEGKEYLKSKTKEEQKEKLENTNSRYIKNLVINERYLDFSKENKIEIVKDFINSDKGILKVKSPMGTSKSSAIELAINLAHEKNENVILVSNRVSVAKDFTDKYNIMNYKNEGINEHNGSLVVQYESLHRFNLNDYDVVIFDEFISLLLHHRANLTDNSNINAIKFKILLDNKKVLVADAFLTGYEDTFFNNRDIYSITNSYKDDTNIYEYKNREFFITSLINRCKEIKENEHLTCSFTSSNVLKVVESKLRDLGIRVVSLTSETSESTRDIIYNKFKSDTHNSFQVLLFTPTLTVGVSNLNNILYHFHFDSSMSADVISSLQMIKRSRNTKEIHYYIAERQLYQDTSIVSLNNQAQNNIATHYNKKDKTLLVDVDYNTGNLVLTKLAKYINKIEVFYNILSNNHANAFRTLLTYQFKNKPIIIENVDESFSLSKNVKIIKEKLKKDNIDIIDKYSDVVWNPIEIEELRYKSGSLTKEESVKVLLDSIQSKFKKKMPRKELIKLSKFEVDSNFTFISKIKNVKLVFNSDNTYTKYLLSTSLSKNVSSLQNSDKEHIKFLKYLLKFNKDKLKPWYSKQDIKDVESSKSFEVFLKKLGYRWNNSKLKIQEEIFDYLEYL